jgi:antitoxin VapB
MISLSRETEALARRLAELQSVSPEDAIHQALAARAYGFGVRPDASRLASAPEAVAARKAMMEHHVRAIAALPILDPRPPDAIMDELNAV